MKIVDAFSVGGHLLQRLHRNPDGSQWSLVCRYDEQERILEKEESADLFNDYRRFSYKYDQVGRIERVDLHSAKSGDRVYESVQYVADGTKTVTSYPIQLDDAQRNTTVVSTESSLHLSLETAVEVTIFDAYERPLRKVLYDDDERVIRRIGFCYDTRGLLVEEGELIGGRIRKDFRNVYRWDTLGRQTEVCQQYGDLGGERKAFFYNDRGDVAQESINQNLGLTTDATESQNWTQRYSYQYDHHGNWIERATETISDLKTRLSMTERRELTYY